MEDAEYCDEDGVKKVGEIRIPKTKESQGKRTDDLISFTNNDDSSESDDVI